MDEKQTGRLHGSLEPQNIEQGISNYEVERFSVGGLLRVRFEEHFVLVKPRIKERISFQIRVLVKILQY